MAHAISVGSKAAGGVSSGKWAGFLHWLQEMRLRAYARSELGRFSDLELKDIGLYRGDIEAAITGRIER